MLGIIQKMDAPQHSVCNFLSPKQASIRIFNMKLQHIQLRRGRVCEAPPDLDEALIFKVRLGDVNIIVFSIFHTAQPVPNPSGRSIYVQNHI